MIRAILFDAVGTILRPEPSVAAAYAAIGRRYGVSLVEAEANRRFRDAFAGQDAIDRQNDWATSELRERERWREIVGQVLGEPFRAGNRQSMRGEQAFADLWDHFATPDNWRLFDDVAVTFDRLRSAGVTLGIASNFDARLRTICRETPALADVEHLFVSSELRCRKPGAEFFRRIERTLALSAEEILLVGDDELNDYQAARAAGWHAVLIDRGDNKTNGHSLSNLAELTI